IDLDQVVVAMKSPCTLMIVSTQLTDI
ncbi:MAG: hypothetical protein RJA18_1277, partial [Pseudomonadota bacterium]